MSKHATFECWLSLEGLQPAALRIFNDQSLVGLEPSNLTLGTLPVCRRVDYGLYVEG
jgi:hypothetical protein